jgi:hypothetical protein
LSARNEFARIILSSIELDSSKLSAQELSTCKMWGFKPAAVVETPLPEALHPFYPLGVEIANYVANDMEALELLTKFLSGWAVILGTTWWAVGKYSPQLSKSDKTIMLWFVLSTSKDTHDMNNRR